MHAALFSIAQSVSTTTGRTPLNPFASAFARNRIIARVSAIGKRRPDAARMGTHQIHLQLANLSREIRTLASLPNPVLIP